MNSQRATGSPSGTNGFWSRIFNVHFLLAPFLIFSYFFNLAILDIRNVGWLLRGGEGSDLSMSFVGWLAFQHDEWRWPLTWTYLVNTPDGTSVSATDSNPLASILLKPFASILPDTSQFIGPWFLLSVFLTYLISYGILKRLTAQGRRCRDWFERAALVAGAALITMAPYLYMRANHNTLTSQWLILAAIYGFLFMRSWTQIAAFFVIIGVSVLVHPYFTPMVLLLAAIAAFRNFWEADERLSIRTLSQKLVIPSAAYVVALIGAYVFVGLWKLQGQTGSPIGYYTMDPFAWFNSMGNSLFLPTWETGPGQYEGYQYLGLGVIAVAAISIGAILAKRAAVPNEIQEAKPWLAIYAVVLFFLAVSPIVTVFGKELIDTGIHKIPVLGSFLTIFRSSGRLFWPVSYLVGIVFVSTLVLVRRRWAFGVLVGALALQIIDLQPTSEYLHTDATKTRSPTQMLKSLDTWDQLLAPTKELVFMPATFITSSDRDLFYGLLARAIPRHVTSNLMVVARNNVRNPDPAVLMDAMLAAPPETWLTSDRLIVLTKDFAFRLACLPGAPLGFEPLFLVDGVVIRPGHPLALSSPMTLWECPDSMN